MMDIDNFMQAMHAGDFMSYHEISNQHPCVTRAFQSHDAFHLAATWGGLLTLPCLQKNGLRLEILANLSAMLGKRKRRPTQSHIAAWFNQIGEGIYSRYEDPAEDVFLGCVYDDTGNYRIFEGLYEAATLCTQITLDILKTMPSNSFYDELRASVYSALKLSDAIAERGKLERNIVDSVNHHEELPKFSKSDFDKLKKLTVFTFEELDALGINIKSLAPFIYKDSHTRSLSECTINDAPLNANPIMQSGDKIAVIIPSALAFAARMRVIEVCLAIGQQDSYEKAQANAYGKILHEESIFGGLGGGMPVKFVRCGSVYIANVPTKVDVGRYLNFVIISDGLNDYENSGFLGQNPIQETTNLIKHSISQIKNKLEAIEGFKEAVSVIILCGWGRNLVCDDIEDTQNWRTVCLPIQDLLTLSQISNFCALDVFRILDAQSKLEDMSIKINNVNGFLNLYAWMRDNEYNIVPHTAMASDSTSSEQKIFFQIPSNNLLSLRMEARQGTDKHNVALPSGELVTVCRLNEGVGDEYGDYKPFYYERGLLDPNRRRRVYEACGSTFWIEFSFDPCRLNENRAFHIYKMIFHWAERTCRELTKLEIFHSKVIQWQVTFLDEFVSTFVDIEAQPEIRDIVKYSVDSHHNLVNIEVQKGFIKASSNPHNRAETQIVISFVKSAYEVFGYSIEDKKLNEIVKTIIPDGARHYHVIATPKIRTPLHEVLPAHPKTISELDFAEFKLGLGWAIRSRNQSATIEGKDACCQYLNDLVTCIGKNGIESLRKFSRAEVAEKILLNYESLMLKLELWIQTAGTESSDESEKTQARRLKEVSEIYNATLASRIVIEMAICVCPEDGTCKIGERELGELLVMASYMLQLGGNSDVIRIGLVQPTVKISPAGDVLMDSDFYDETIQPFGEKSHQISFDYHAQNYSKNYRKGSNEDADEQANLSVKQGIKFRQAWLNDYKFSIEDTDKFIAFFADILQQTEKPVLQMPLSNLKEKIHNAKGLSLVKVGMMVNNFSLKPRTQWNKVLPPYLSNAWQPWRFRRQLSLMSKPIIQLDKGEDPSIMFAPGMVYENLLHFVTGVCYGDFDEAFFAKNGELQKWVGFINNKHGSEFNEQVACKFRQNGWNAEANLTDSQITSLPHNKKFGDVDVLAWRPESGRVLVVECKKIMLDKTPTEIARRLEKYQGISSNDGRRDNLRKHIDRYEYLKKHKEKLENYLNCTISTLEAMLIFEHYSPVHFTKVMKDFAVKVSTINEIKDI